MRAYTTAAAALTLGVSQKWVDNVLSHHRVHGVVAGRQGASRRLAPHAVLTLEITRQLASGAAIPISYALQLAAEASRSTSPTHHIPIGTGTSLVIDVDAIRTELNHRLAIAVETAPVPLRGRPPDRRK